MPRAFERLRFRHGLRAALRALGPLVLVAALVATVAGAAQAQSSVRVAVEVGRVERICGALKEAL